MGAEGWTRKIIRDPLRRPWFIDIEMDVRTISDINRILTRHTNNYNDYDDDYNDYNNNCNEKEGKWDVRSLQIRETMDTEHILCFASERGER